jgi:hypothetical protein
MPRTPDDDLRRALGLLGGADSQVVTGRAMPFGDVPTDGRTAIDRVVTVDDGGAGSGGLGIVTFADGTRSFDSLARPKVKSRCWSSDSPRSQVFARDTASRS